MVIVTGASRGIGQFLMQKLNEEGQATYGSYRDAIPHSPYNHLYFQVDVTDLSSLAKWRSWLLEEGLENITLINCAGINYSASLLKADDSAWKRVIDTNLTGVFSVIKTFLAPMVEQGYGRIINISSVVPQMGIAGTTAYSASKSGLWGLTKSLCKEIGHKGITVNNINLGYFDIGMIQEVPAKIKEQIRESIPCKAFGRPEDILNTVKYIQSTPYLNGTSINLNGGLF